ncbi:MAG: trigger factor [Bacilli bacterium]|nr:trigger factor [Bacilli bacterium]MDD3304526.1 trigger factor [Bacilli bacterium]MDD4053906.1 trigger factor [Bacilli bacterium]MDD4411275.1 trigger factor [Bacilli bacterium]
MSKQKFIVKIEKEDWEGALDKSFQKNVKKTKIDGFREGKAPRDIYEKKLGKESLYMDAIDFVLPDAYSKLLKDNSLEPVAQPNVDIKNIDDSGIEVEFVVITKPEIKIKKYKKLGLKKQPVEVTKEEVEKEIDELQKQYAEIVLKEEAIEIGDTAVIDFQGFKDDVAFEGGKGENYPLEIGSKTFIPGFEEQLVGLKDGEEKDIKVTFPEDYPSEDLKGCEVTFKVKINEVKTKVIPELNEDFYKDLGIEGVSSKETLYSHMEKEISLRKEEANEQAFAEQVLEEIAKDVDVEIPHEMIDDEIHFMLEQLEQNLNMQGIQLEQFMQMANTTHEKLHEEYEKPAHKRVLQSLILNEVAKLENIEISDAEVDAEIPLLALKYQLNEEEIKQLSGLKDAIKGDLKMRKIFTVLKENN